MPPRPRTSVTCEGSSLAPLLNRIGSSYPGTGTLTPGMSRVNRLVALPLAALAVAAALSIARSSDAPAARDAAAAPTTRELVGQRLMVAMRGTRPSPALLGRVRRGEIGGIILFGANITGPAQLRALTGELQSAARAVGSAAAPDRDRSGGRACPPGPLGRTGGERAGARRIERDADPARGAPCRTCAPGRRNHGRSRAGG